MFKHLYANPSYRVSGRVPINLMTTIKKITSFCERISLYLSFMRTKRKRGGGEKFKQKNHAMKRDVEIMVT
jgi:hypothetical protein